MSDSAATHKESSHDDHEDHGGLGKYIVVFVALCALTSASFFTYSSYWPFHDQKHVTWAFMMAVSVTKAMLVVMFFMHLLWEANWKYVLTVPASFMSLFLVLMLVPDVGMRQNNGYAKYSQDRLLHAADPPAVAATDHEDSQTSDHEDGQASDHENSDDTHAH